MDRTIRSDLTPRRINKTLKYDYAVRSFSGPLSVDIEYSHIYGKSSSNQELDRALRRQKEERKKTEKQFYFRDYKNIERICDYLQLPSSVKREAFNIRLQLGKKNKYFNRKSYYKTSAVVKIAAKMHDYPINERELIQLTKGSFVIKKGDIVKVKGNPVKKEIDKHYVNIMKLLKIHINPPKKPNFIAFACNKLNLLQKCENQLYDIYSKINKFFNPSCSIKGYVLAIIYILYNKEYNVRYIDLEKTFVINRATIVSRKREINKIFERINYGEIKG